MALRILASQAVSTLRIRCLPTLENSLVLQLNRSYASDKSSRKFLESHEWVSPDGEIATIGITDFAQHALGDVVYVELPDVGADVTKGAKFGVVESVKAASDVYSPVSGSVVEVNEVLKEEPELVNKGPFSDGWMMKVKMAKPEELDSLLGGHDYKKLTE